MKVLKYTTHSIKALTVPMPCHDLSQTEVDMGIGLQQRHQLPEGMCGEQLCNLSNVLQTLAEETLPLGLILKQEARRGGGLGGGGGGGGLYGWREERRGVVRSSMGRHKLAQQ